MLAEAKNPADLVTHQEVQGAQENQSMFGLEADHNGVAHDWVDNRSASAR